MVQGVGVVSVSTQSSEKKQPQGVQFVPGLAHNLLSVRQLSLRGIQLCLIKINAS